MQDDAGWFAEESRLERGEIARFFLTSATLLYTVCSVWGEARPFRPEITPSFPLPTEDEVATRIGKDAVNRSDASRGESQ
jgi:hypothetical protein